MYVCKPYYLNSTLPKIIAYANEENTKFFAHTSVATILIILVQYYSCDRIESIRRAKCMREMMSSPVIPKYLFSCRFHCRSPEKTGAESRPL